MWREKKCVYRNFEHYFGINKDSSTYKVMRVMWCNLSKGIQWCFVFYNNIKEYKLKLKYTKSVIKFLRILFGIKALEFFNINLMLWVFSKDRENIYVYEC